MMPLLLQWVLNSRTELLLYIFRKIQEMCIRDSCGTYMKKSHTIVKGLMIHESGLLILTLTNHQGHLMKKIGDIDVNVSPHTTVNTTKGGGSVP